MAEPEQRPEGAWGLEYVPLNEMLNEIGRRTNGAVLFASLNHKTGTDVEIKHVNAGDLRQQNVLLHLLESEIDADEERAMA